MNELNELALSVAANCLSVPLIAVAAYLFYWVVSAFSRRKLFRFFGITSKKPNISIYVSRLEVIPGGTISVGNLTGTDDITHGYSGPAINYVEYEGAQHIRHLLRANALAILPDWGRTLLRHLLGQYSIQLLQLDPEIMVSPLYENEIDFQRALFAKRKLSEKLDVVGMTPREYFEKLQKQIAQEREQAIPFALDRNMIVIGDQLYNYVSQFCAQTYKDDFPFTFKKDSDGERSIFIGDYKIPGRVRGREDNCQLGIIHRLQQDGNTVFICAGTGSRATKASAMYLAKHWEDLSEQPDHFPAYLRIWHGLGPDDGHVNVAADVENITTSAKSEAHFVNAGSRRSN